MTPGHDAALTGMTKRYGSAVVVDEVDLFLAGGGFTALLGPSGCGKSTLLAMIAGLVTPDAGEVRIDGEPLSGVRAEKRPVGLVFQKPLLFPQLTVAANVGFGLRMRRVSRKSAGKQVEEMLEKVQLSGLGQRRVGELSGGQEQRVALARALILQPRLLLLDEPFSQLDAELRAAMRALVRTLTADAAITTLFVTHDQAEAVEVADQIALMLDGAIEGFGAPQMFYRRPPSLRAARFFEVTNELPGMVRSGVFRADGCRGEVGTDCVDGSATAVCRPESWRLCAEPNPAGVQVAGTLTAVRFAGTHLVATVTIPAANVSTVSNLSTVSSRSTGRELTVHVPVGTPLTIGELTWIGAGAADCTVFAQ